MSAFGEILYVAPHPIRADSAFEQALTLAAGGVARLTLATALERIEDRDHLEGTSLSPAELEEAVRRSRAEHLEALAARARARGIRAEPRVLLGKPAVEIVREVVRREHDLLIKEAGPPGGRRRRRPGGLDLKLIRTCPCPVWTARPGARRLDRILVAVDPDPSDHAKTLLARSLVDLAASVALSEGADLYVLHAWSLYGEGELRGGFINLPSGEVERLLRAARRRRSEWLEDLVAPYRTRSVRIHSRLRKGRPEEVIVQTVERERIDLVVMGTVARGGIPGILIGNTAETVLATLERSLLTVKPPGFVTPIRLRDAGG